MRIDAIDGSLWKKMLEAGSASLYASRKTINDLNVFPIPDGDTGDNMYLTISSGCSAAADTEGSLGAVATAAGRGMLLGARGNSGVILSRIFAGVAKGFGDAESVDAEGLSLAMESGVKEAYAAVGQPVEGTILTVFREGVEQARKSGADDISAWFSAFLDEMRASLDRTPDLLPVLAEAGVVDSGGAGFLVIASGMKDALEGRVTESETQVQESAAKSLNIDAFGADDELRFGYCTEFLLRLQNAKVGDAENCDISEIRDWLDSVGESVVCFRDGSIVKVHVHTMDPGAILSHARRWGEFLSVKVENMMLQHSEATIQNNFKAPEEKVQSFVSRKRCAVVAVAAGKGIADAFREAGADVVVEGGQTMNPSAADFVAAFEAADASRIYVFPNNSNVIMAARQAAEIYTGSEVVVIPSRNEGAGYVAVASLDRDCRDSGEVLRAAEETMAGVTACMVSRAVRDASVDGVAVKEGEYLGFVGDTVLAADADRSAAALSVVAKAGIADHEVALVFYGGEVADDDAAALLSSLQGAYPRTEFMLIDGDQPVYDYIITLC